jgi:uncharacterized membrane protein YfcA
VSLVHKEQFTPFLLVVLGLVLVYTMLRPNLGMHAGPALAPQRHWWYSLLTGIIIGLYDGCIGPGTGSFLVFIYVAVFGYSFVKAAAHAKLVNCVTNAAALLLFLYQGAILWQLALPMAAANMLGNYAGTKLALRKGSGFIRVFFMLVVTALLCKLGWEYLHR